MGGRLNEKVPRAQMEVRVLKACVCEGRIITCPIEDCHVALACVRGVEKCVKEFAAIGKGFWPDFGFGAIFSCIQNGGCRNKKEHEEHLKAFLELLKKEELYAKFSKCLAGYYRRFIEGFSKIAKPMTKLTQKKVAFEWGDKQEAAF
ncbi:hypothetical protein Tco_0678431 [Tanacetum coccineum]|uniref:Reverse transcriptase domain-containing protein n=1 Tax=Tanacetum coccineum TaxID=301880 RepID=A0ABQ4XGC9_9ASTR